MAKLITLENGKPLAESLGEIIYSSDYVEFYSEEARRIHVKLFKYKMQGELKLSHIYRYINVYLQGEILSSPAKSKEMMFVREPIGVVAMLVPVCYPNCRNDYKYYIILIYFCSGTFPRR